MNAREKFLATLSFQDPDEIYYAEQGLWSSTNARWYKEGLPNDAHIPEFFGWDRWEFIGVETWMVPPFEPVVLEEDNETRVVIDSMGIRKRELKISPEKSMPQYLEFPVKNREDFEKMKKRFNSKSPSRYPPYWEDKKRCFQVRDYPLCVYSGSLFGWLRHWMGLENLLVAFHDEPSFVYEMMEFLSNHFVETIKKAVEEVKSDFALIHEDMAYKTSSLISPDLFRKFMTPNYKRVTSLLHSNGIKNVFVDSDGNIEELIPLWLDVGINGFTPLEVASGMDVVKLRKRYGKNILMWGGIDKRALIQGKQEIEEEVMSKVPLSIEKGGFIPSIDHTIPPDVSFDNFMYYTKLMHRLVGK